MALGPAVYWLLALGGAAALSGIAAGWADGWADARGGGPVAHSGALIGLDLTLVAVVAVPAALGVPWGPWYRFAWLLLALVSFGSLFVSAERGLRGAIAGVALAITAVGMLLQYAIGSLPADPTLWAIAEVVRTVVVTVTAIVGTLGGWAVGRAVTESPVIARAGEVTQRSSRWAVWVRDSIAYQIHRVRPTLGKVAGWGIGIGIVIAIVGGVAEEESIFFMGPSLAALGMAPWLLSHVTEIAAALAAALSTFLQMALASLLSLSGAFRRRSRVLARTVLVLQRFPRALCDTCLRMDAPLASSYAEGVRTCSKCGGTISFKGGGGRLVVVFDDTSVCGAPRVFVRSAKELVRADTVVDVTHVRLVGQFAEHEVERLVAFLKQRPPGHSLRQIEVYADGGRDGVKPYLRNLLSDHFSWATSDPFSGS